MKRNAAAPRAAEQPPVLRSAAQAGQPVFNLTCAIELLKASVESDIGFGTPEQPYPAGEDIRARFLSGRGMPLTPLREGVSDSEGSLPRFAPCGCYSGRTEIGCDPAGTST